MAHSSAAHQFTRFEALHSGSLTAPLYFKVRSIATQLILSAYEMLPARGASALARKSLRQSPYFFRHASTFTRTATGQSRTVGLTIKKPVTTSLGLYKPLSTNTQHYADAPGISAVELKHEQEIAHRKLRPHPDEVSTSSSVHQVFHEKGEQIKEEDEPDMLAGVWSDLVGFPVGAMHRPCI